VREWVFPVYMNVQDPGSGWEYIGPLWGEWHDDAERTDWWLLGLVAHTTAPEGDTWRVLGPPDHQPVGSWRPGAAARRARPCGAGRRPARCGRAGWRRHVALALDAAGQRVAQRCAAGVGLVHGAAQVLLGLLGVAFALEAAAVGDDLLAQPAPVGQASERVQEVLALRGRAVARLLLVEGRPAGPRSRTTSSAPPNRCCQLR
jgi:hypothetical protein